MDYTFEQIYTAKLADLLNVFEETHNAEPNGHDLMQLQADARIYARDFMENYSEWRSDADRDDRNTR